MSDPKATWKPKDMDFLATVVLCLKEPLGVSVIDFDRLASRLDYSNVRSARNYWSDLQKRMAAIAISGDDGPGPTSSPTKNRAGGRGKQSSRPKNDDEAGESNDDDVSPDAPAAAEDPEAPTTPPPAKKKSRASPLKRKAPAAIVEGEIPKTPRRTRKTANGEDASPRKKGLPSKRANAGNTATQQDCGSEAVTTPDDDGSAISPADAGPGAILANDGTIVSDEEK